MFVIMCLMTYYTDHGIMEDVPVAYDDYRYETREDAERGLDELEHDPRYAGELFYIKEV